MIKKAKSINFVQVVLEGKIIGVLDSIDTYSLVNIQYSCKE